MSTTRGLHPAVVMFVFSQAVRAFVLEKIECPHNPAICETPTCYFNATAAKPQLYHVYIGCRLKKTVPKMQVKIETYIRTGKDYVRLKAVDFAFNFCDVNRFSDNKILKIVAPGIAEQLQTIVGPCPYEIEFKFDCFELDGTAIPDLFGQKNNKAVIKFTRGLYEPVYTIIFYGNSRSSL